MVTRDEPVRSYPPVSHPRFTGTVHTPHPLHLDESHDWIDTNCYTDLWIELLHGLGLDPYPMLAFTLGVDFEGDQWTFFKPPLGDLSRLYGIEVVELAVYRPLSEHASTQLERGHVAIMEADAFYLPDVSTTHHRKHAKTTVAVVAVNEATRTARCLHNSTCLTVTGDDFDGLFRLADRSAVDGVLPPYVEVAKLASLRHANEADLRRLALELAEIHAAAPHRDSAMDRFLDTFDREIGRIAGDRSADFDGYAFATLRQLGAACALGARFVRWLGADLDDVAAALDILSRCAKQLILKSARSVATGRVLDGRAIYAEMAARWHDVGERIGVHRAGGRHQPTAAEGT